MSTMTLESRLAEDALTRRAEELADYPHVATLRHEDGSITVVHQQMYDTESSNPRTFDGNVATLVNLHRDYVPMDEPDAGLAEAREHFAGYGEHWTTAPTWGRGEQSQHDTEYMMGRYVAMFRPDIAHYEHEWSVSGYSQGDWQNGWGYVTRAALAEAGYSQDEPGRLNGTLRMRAASLFQEELSSYGDYFRGDVYVAVNLTVGEPVVILGDEGGYVADYTVEEEWVGGFLGMKPAAIAAELTSSPVTEEA